MNLIKNNIPANNLVDYLEAFSRDTVDTLPKKSTWYKKIREIQNHKGKWLLFPGSDTIAVDKK
jgi:hypothetical protein